MTEKTLEGLLSKKMETPARKNVSVLLSPDITRSAMRLKKRRQDRIQAVLCLLAALVFAALTGGLIYMTGISEHPGEILRPAAIAALSAMGLTLLLAPALAWYSEENKNEA